MRTHSPRVGPSDAKLLNTDRPIERATDDTLGRTESADFFARAVMELDASHGLVVGIMGPWGSGKTSYLNLARQTFEHTFQLFPEESRKTYSGPERVSGKRDETFVAYRRLFDADAEASVLQSTAPENREKPVRIKMPETGKNDRRRIVELSKRIPREHVDLLMILLDMPVELRSPPNNNTIERMTRLIEWADASGKLPELYEELQMQVL